MYLVKQTAQRLGCSTNALRFYEKKGIVAPHRDENGYRKYTDADIERLQFVLLYRQLGFSVDAIRQIIACEGRTRLDVFIAQYRVLTRQIHSMVQIRDVLGCAVDELLVGSELSPTVQAQFEGVIQLISENENESDRWGFDNWAANYDTDIRTAHGGLPFYQNYDAVVGLTAREAAKASGDIVEIGIGTGNLAREVIACYESTHDGQQPNITGIDQSINMLQEAKRKLPRVPMRVGTFLKLPLENGCCDTVVSSYAFHHCDDREKVLAVSEMDRVLRPHGRIIITDLMFADDAALEDLADEFFANVDALETIFTAKGYRVTAVQIDPLIWMVVAAKA